MVRFGSEPFQLLRLSKKLGGKGQGRQAFMRTTRKISNGRFLYASDTTKSLQSQLGTFGTQHLALPSLPTTLVQRSSFKTSAVNKAQCLPTPLPPKCGPTNCIIPKPNIWRDCKAKKRPKWKGCEKICMPCCCPAHSPPDCESVEIRHNTCKKLEYRIPSFSECRKYPLGKRSKKECCYSEPPCPEAGIETIVEPLIATKVRQEIILGRRTGNKRP